MSTPRFPLLLLLSAIYLLTNLVAASYFNGALLVAQNRQSKEGVLFAFDKDDKDLSAVGANLPASLMPSSTDQFGLANTVINGSLTAFLETPGYISVFSPQSKSWISMPFQTENLVVVTSMDDEAIMTLDRSGTLSTYPASDFLSGKSPQPVDATSLSFGVDLLAKQATSWDRYIGYVDPIAQNVYQINWRNTGPILDGPTKMKFNSTARFAFYMMGPFRGCTSYCYLLIDASSKLAVWDLSRFPPVAPTFTAFLDPSLTIIQAIPVDPIVGTGDNPSLLILASSNSGNMAVFLYDLSRRSITTKWPVDPAYSTPAALTMY